MSLTIDAFIRQVGDMPSLPTIYHEIQREVSDPRSTTQSISDVICKDQSLASRLLRLSNSAMYGFSSRIDSIAEAVQLIGTREMRDLALATVVIGAFKGIPPELIDVKSFWQHSISCAAGTRILAHEFGEKNVERYFVGGLLHDVGRLVFYMKIPEESKKVIEYVLETAEFETKVETELIGFNHADLAGHLLETWRLPPALCEMARFHHRPSNAKAAMLECAMVHLADIFVNAMALGSSGETNVPPYDEKSWERTGIDIERLPELLGQLKAEASEMCQILMS